VAIAGVSFELEGRARSSTPCAGRRRRQTTFSQIVVASSAHQRGLQINFIDVTAPHPDFGSRFSQSNLIPWRSLLQNVLSRWKSAHENNRAALGAGDGARRCLSHKASISPILAIVGGMQQRVRCAAP